ncbi:hypothetical protein WR25_10422 [Diploscapter pachys]|uniref:Uncharacterized protein n=1 Tax=Diploscapter pachys TaxID=2018661 RepID=A0A2A2JLS2_9BILA|nr:hypothetical protein WR25_10422 [Diploscapter pachys]
MKHASTGSYPVILLIALSVAAVISSAVMLYGIFSEQARLITPKLAFVQFEIGILMVIAFATIIVMSVGIELTNALFGTMFKVDVLEEDFGPIWPFNISVLCFYWAAICVWMRIVIQGTYDFILDKHYFSESSNMPIEMAVNTR